MEIKNIAVRWHDGYLEKFEAAEVRFGSDLLWMKLTNGERRCIPTRSVRWFDPGENHARMGQEEFPDNTSKGLSDFLQEMFVQENMSEEEKERILNMSIREFCNFCSDIKGAPVEEPKLTRTEFMSNMAKVPCGICHSTNALSLIDGIITCKVCGATLGDIDKYPTSR